MGAEAITAFLGEAITISNGTFQLEVTKLFADDDTGIALCHAAQMASLATAAI